MVGCEFPDDASICTTIDIDIVIYMLKCDRAMKHGGFQSQWRKGFIGICALNMMTTEPVYGNMLATSLYELSDHQWKPGPGAIYPALHKLIKDKLAVARKEDGRMVYTITRKGRSLLEGIRTEAEASQRYAIDFGRIWLSALKPDNATDILLRRLRMNLSTVEAVLEGKQFALSESEKEYLLNQALGELRRVTGKLESRMGKRAGSPGVKNETGNTIEDRTQK